MVRRGPVGALAAVLATSVALAACAGGRGTEHVVPLASNPYPDARWELVRVDGLTLGTAETEALLVEVAGDGRTATVFYQGGNPACYTLSGVRFERRDPDPPLAFVSTGLRLGVMGCDAALYPLAVRVALEPPLAP